MIPCTLKILLVFFVLRVTVGPGKYGTGIAVTVNGPRKAHMMLMVDELSVNQNFTPGKSRPTSRIVLGVT